MTGYPLGRANYDSECCRMPVKVTDQEVYHPKAGCFGYLDGKGCKIRRVEWCAKCGKELKETVRRDKFVGIDPSADEQSEAGTANRSGSEG